jgi:hypothetical protein
MLFVILIIGGDMLFWFLISEGKIVTFQHVVKRVFECEIILYFFFISEKAKSQKLFCIVS